MISRPILLVAAFALVTAVTPASAQLQTGSTGSRVALPIPAEIREKGSAEDSNLVLMREFARCTYTRGPRQVAEAVMLTPGEDGAALGKLAVGNCLEAGTMRFSPSLFRGALFGELYRRHERPDAGTWRLPVKPLAPDAPPAVEAAQAERANYFMMALADCVHEAAPQEMRDIVIQPAASAAQKNAFSVIIPKLGPCVPQGLTLTLNRMTLEHAFAEYLYRAQPAPVDAGAA